MKRLTAITLRHAVAALLIATAGTVRADNPVVSIEGTYTYHGEPSDSPADCRRKAAQGARIEALKQFGTILSQTVMSTESDSGDKAVSMFLSVSESEVKGEWLGDDGEPTYDMSFDNDGSVVVSCHIRGRGRRLSNEAPEFDALVLRNGTGRRNADTRFRSGDDMYVLLAAPVNGYTQVYVEDESREVYCLLPYPHDPVDNIKVRRGHEYVFFDPGHADSSHGNVDEVILTAGNHIEYNKVYVIFSPEAFAPAPVRFKSDGVPPSVDSEEFARWLIRNRRNDPRMGVKSILVTILPDGKDTETIVH